MKLVVTLIALTFSANLLAFTHNIYNQEVASITTQTDQGLQHVYLHGRTMFNKDVSFYLTFSDASDVNYNILKDAFFNQKKVNVQLFFDYQSGVTPGQFQQELEANYRPSDANAAVFTFAPKVNARHIRFIKVLR